MDCASTDCILTARSASKTDVFMLGTNYVPAQTWYVYTILYTVDRSGQVGMAFRITRHAVMPLRLIFSAHLTMRVTS